VDREALLSALRSLPGWPVQGRETGSVVLRNLFARRVQA